MISASSELTLSTSASSLYVYSPDTALASLTGTLDYIIDVDAGQTVTEAQIKANASILFKSGMNASQQTLSWTDSR